MRRILAYASQNNDVSNESLHNISEDSVVPIEVIMKSKDKIHEALDELGLGDLEIKEIVLSPRSDLYPEAEFSICCAGEKCKLC